MKQDYQKQAKHYKKKYADEHKKFIGAIIACGILLIFLAILSSIATDDLEKNTDEYIDVIECIGENTKCVNLCTTHSDSSRCYTSCANNLRECVIK